MNQEFTRNVIHVTLQDKLRDVARILNGVHADVRVTFFNGEVVVEIGDVTEVQTCYVPPRLDVDTDVAQAFRDAKKLRRRGKKGSRN